MHKMRKQLMTKKRRDGSTSMVMFSDSQSINHCLRLPLVLALSCLHCKHLTVFCMYIKLSLYWSSLLKIFFCLLLVFSTVFIFMLALVGVFYPYNRGALFTALVVIYALTSGIAGYTATSFYCQLEGTNWVSVDVSNGNKHCFYFLRKLNMNWTDCILYFMATGEEPIAYRVPFLWSSVPHILLPQHCCHCI